MKTITKLTAVKLFSLMLLGLFISSSIPENKSENDYDFEEAYDNSIWVELMKDLNNGKCYKMEATSNNVKKKSSSEELAFTTFGQSDVRRVNNSTIEMKNVKTSFSDRGLFRGRTTKESFRISCTSRAFTVKITQHDWGNRTETLRDAKIFRGAYGYFITGNYYTGRKLTFCTISLYKLKCSGLI